MSLDTTIILKQHNTPDQFIEIHNAFSKDGRMVREHMAAVIAERGSEAVFDSLTDVRHILTVGDFTPITDDDDYTVTALGVARKGINRNHPGGDIVFEFWRSGTLRSA